MAGSPKPKMSADFQPVFAALRAVMAEAEPTLVVKADNRTDYTLVTKSPSPFPQHKGEPMWFGAVRQGRAYVSYHLMPLYMNPALTAKVSEALRKRMQGKTCFNFKSVPEKGLLDELGTL